MARISEYEPALEIRDAIMDLTRAVWELVHQKHATLAAYPRCPICKVLLYKAKRAAAKPGDR